MSQTLEFQMTGLPEFDKITKSMFRGVRNAMNSWANAYLKALVETRLSGSPGLNRRTGNLARDWVVSVDGTTLSDLSTTVKTQGPANAYAGILERGGDIVPTKAKWLWIPLDANKTSAGVERISPTEAIATGNLFIDWKNGPVAYLGSGTNRAGGSRKLTPLFVLKKRVHVNAQMGAGSLFQSMLPKLETLVALELQGAWSDKGGATT